MHADICSDLRDPPFPKLHERGRFLHCAWKPDRVSNCTTEVVPYGFTEGQSCSRDYSRLRSVAAPVVVIDSEMLHRGGVSLPRFSSTCTVQLCSGRGWPALNCGTRCDADLIQFTVPIQPPPGLQETQLWHKEHGKAGKGSKGAKGHGGQGQIVFQPYAKVEARSVADSTGAWYPAVVDCRIQHGLYNVLFDDYHGATERVASKDIRPRSQRSQA